MAESPRPTTSRRRLPAWAAVLLDAGSIALFAGIGRQSHSTGDALTGIPQTAWTFWAGAALGWVATAAVRRRVPSTLAEGAVVLVATILVGMALRQLTDQGTATPFVVVATLSLTLLLLGWRLVAGWLLRR
ncbi:DUF3054 domain-containing protein [Kytococcus sedentarius]|uniref:DUF3054 domain-containing protein n=1 Tax=Kytococcus sedentarius TaxID=1276 RepID=UPI00384CEBCC